MLRPRWWVPRVEMPVALVLAGFIGSRTGWLEPRAEKKPRVSAPLLVSGSRASVTCVARAEGVPAFTMNQLAAFVAVAEAGTISGAAERLHVSPSALSAAVTELERALQTQLLHRRKAKGVSLSPAGEVVLPRARHLLYQASELEADARGDERGVTGVVRLGCYPSLAPTVLPVLLSEFTRAHPEARVEVAENTQDQLTRASRTASWTWRSCTTSTSRAPGARRRSPTSSRGSCYRRPPPRRVRAADRPGPPAPGPDGAAGCAAELQPRPRVLRQGGLHRTSSTAPAPTRRHAPSSAAGSAGPCCSSGPAPT